MNSLLVAVALGGLLLSGCSQSGSIPSRQKLKNAPTEASRTGLLVLGAQESDVAQMALSDETLLVRPINKQHGLYEIHGAAEAQLREQLGQNISVQKNSYRNMSVAQSADFPSMNSSLQDDFLDQCMSYKADEKAFDIILKNKIDKFEISHIYELGNKVSAQFEPSEAYRFLWAVDGKSEISTQVEFKPETSGEFVLSVIAQNPKGDCFVRKKSLYITANPKLKLNAGLSPIEKSEFNLDGFWHLEHLQMNKVWQKSKGQDILIAVIDTGVNYNHESLNENIFINESEIPDNNIDDDGNGYIDDSYGYDFSSSDPYPFDDNGHGSHVAGLAAASTFGIAKQAKILPLKTLTGLGTDTGSFVGAIYYAVDQGADVINASFGWREDHSIFRKAMQYARDKGVLVITASGNEQENNDIQANYPANYDYENIISVAAIDEDNELAPYSNYGPQNVDVAAPGGTSWLKLYSTAYMFSEKLYVAKSGTSQAAPLVSGLAALMLSIQPDLSPLDIKNLMLENSETHEKLQGKVLADGYIDFHKTIVEAH